MNLKGSPYENNAIFKFWNVIYPIFIYFVAINLAVSLFAVFAAFLGADIQKQYMALQTAAVAVTLPFIVRYYRKDQKEPTAFWERMKRVSEKKTSARKAANAIWMVLAGASAGAALNNLLALTALKEISRGFQEANSNFFAGGIFFELLGACLLTPCLEEVLYRGVVYGRLCDLLLVNHEEQGAEQTQKAWKNRLIAMALSALLFGVLHQNLVQFVYAGALGLMLAWFMEETGHLYGPLLAHIGANLISVLRVETGLFQWMEQSRSMFAAATAGLAVVSIVLLGVIWRLNRESV